MKKILLSIAALVTFFASTSGFAQLTGPSLIDRVRDDLSQQRTLKIESNEKSVMLRDAATGAEIFTVRQIDAQTVTLSGVIARLNNLSPERRHEVMQRIAFFNFSSPVGTLGFNNSTGEVVMEHHLNPRYVSASSIASVAGRFNDVARNEATLLVQ